MKSIALALAPVLLVAGCAAGPSVQVMSDPQANFARYQTFGFADPLGTDRNGYQSQVSTALKAATRRAMEDRGFVFAPSNPQLLVNFNAALADRMRVTTRPEPVMDMSVGMGSGMGFGAGYYGYRSGLYAPFPVYRDRTDVTQYKEGTLNIDVADAAAQTLVWEGVVTQTISDKAYKNLGPTINNAVTAAFARFPVKSRGQRGPGSATD